MLKGIPKILDMARIFGAKENQDQKIIQEADNALNLTSELARKCLGHEDFKLYKESYQRTEHSIVNSLILYTKNFIETPGGDITKYAVTNMRLLTRLQDLRHLLRAVENDARRDNKAKEEKSNENEVRKV